MGNFVQPFFTPEKMQKGEPTLKKKACCACPETKKARDAW
jgi:hypothetical protein